MLSNQVFEILKSKGFKADDVTANKEWSKEVEVAFYGKMSEVYEVSVLWLSDEAVQVSFLKNKRVEKRKIYTSSVARIINAIKETVQFAGYEF